MKTAVAYLRVSTREQHLGPEAQRALIETWAAHAGVEVVSFHTDTGVSGSAPVDKRPGLMSALGALRGLDDPVLVVAKRDRLARDVVVAAVAERMTAKAGGRIVSADGVSSEDTPEGALMRTLVDAFAQYERAAIRARTKAALAVKKANGERIGGIPYGMRLGPDGVLLVPDERKADAVALICRLRSAGSTLSDIAQELTEQGHRPRSGGTWHTATVGRIARANLEASRVNGSK